MGGRGKWSQPTDTGFTWYDYHAVYKHNDFHFLVQHDHNDSGVSAPVKSQTPDVTYVTLDRNGTPKHISVYKDRIKQYEIDLDKEHNGMKPHVHHCKENGYRKPKEKDSDMLPTEHDKKLIKLVYGLYNKHKKEITGK